MSTPGTTTRPRTQPTCEQLAALAHITGRITVEPVMDRTRSGAVEYLTPSGRFRAGVTKFVELRGDGLRRTLSGEGVGPDEALASLWARVTDPDRILTVNGNDLDTGVYGEQNYGAADGVFYRLCDGDLDEVIADLGALHDGR